MSHSTNVSRASYSQLAGILNIDLSENLRGKRCGDDGAGFELTIGAAADPAAKPPGWRSWRIGTPIQNDLLYVDMNVKMKPFDNPKVRQAIAWAMPYKSIMDAALFNRGVPMFGGKTGEPYPPHWPVVSAYDTDPANAKQLLAEAGYPSGFKTTLSFDLGEATVHEPIALFLQDSLSKIGVQVTIEKVPGADWFEDGVEDNALRSCQLLRLAHPGRVFLLLELVWQEQRGV